jgi:hypothetical protein
LIKENPMRKTINAVLLSAFVLPGLGQICKGQKVKGAIFLALVNVFFLATLVIVMRKMGNFLLAARMSGAQEAMQALESIRQNSPEIGWLLAGLAILWGAAVIDAAISKPAEQ